MLIEYGADVNALNGDAETPLQVLMKDAKKYDKYIKLLKKSGAVEEPEEIPIEKLIFW